MIVRVQSKNGTKRIDAQPAETLRSFVGKVSQQFGLDPRENFSLFRDKSHRNELTHKHLSLQLSQIPIRHGDLLYLSQQSSASNDVGGGEGGGAEEATPTSTVEEDEVDKILNQTDGKVYRKRHPQLCRHGAQAGCVNCAPLEPWDPQVLESRDPPIKHLSFHCHLRRLTSGVDRGKFVYLEDLSCKIKPGCTDHPQWPEGICTKCQPSAITLARQPYRHVDNVMFEDSKIVDRFIEGWRRSGCQRIGYLYGTYQEYTDVPLGIKAVVAAIYEPPQDSQRYSVELLEDPRDSQVQELAAMLGLRKVGWIFTDLEPDATKKTMVSYKRSIHTHILTGEECVMAADFQNQHPNPCKAAKSGYFGSKFVTVCVSGNETKHVDLKGYQVSNQCMALVRDDCLVPTLDAPELGYIRESTPQQYVPDVFYKTKGEYGGEVTKLGRPLPLEYLIIELTTSTPVNPQPLLVGGVAPPFPVENRQSIGQPIQDFHVLSEYLNNQKTTNFLCAISDFHLLLYLYTSDIAGLDVKPLLPELCRAIREQNRPQAEQWRYREPWATIEQLILASVQTPTKVTGPPSFPPPHTAPDSGAGGNGSWSCKHCTLLNPANVRECEACNLPRDT